MIGRGSQPSTGSRAFSVVCTVRQRCGDRGGEHEPGVHVDSENVSLDSEALPDSELSQRAE